ncbi:MAG: hypothetical protein WD181_02450 [Solirubrobacterales bacterium]
MNWGTLAATQRGALILGTQVAILAVLFVGCTAAASPANTLAASSSGPVRPCNGSVELCSRQFDEVVLPGSHNSMSAADLGWLIPNHDISIPVQIRRGARAMLIDTYYAVNDASLSPFRFRTLGRTEGSAASATMYLCHVTCTWGATELIPEFRKIHDFLTRNPREVMVFVNQDNVTPADFARAVEESGLIGLTYRGSTEDWPTLQQMIDANQRVVFLAEAQAAGVDWYHQAYGGPMQETDYSFSRLPSKWGSDPNGSPTYAGVDKLTDPALLDRSCDSNRGGTAGGLFLMNHWVSGGALNPLEPDPALAQIVNTREALVNRARACENIRGKLPTVLAVDFFGIGDVVGAARELNGVQARAFLELAKPRSITVEAGRTGVFRLTLSNIGTADASGVRFCATVPARLAKPRTCVTAAPIPAGGKSTAAIRLKVEPKARGRATVLFTVSAAGETLGSSAALTVKPVKTRR